jgi:hypothetical protein
VSDPAGTEYAAAGPGIPGRGIGAWESLSRALGVPLDVAVRSLASQGAARMIEARGFPCPGCGGMLLYPSESCRCGHQDALARQRLAEAGPGRLTGAEALALLRRRYVP